MEEVKVHIQHVMLWEFKNNKNTIETTKKISSVYGLGDITGIKRWTQTRKFIKVL